MGNLRTSKSAEKYYTYVAGGGLKNGCRICEAKSLKTFTFWRVIENKFPYDKIAKQHHMIVPKRHVIESKLSAKELKEFQKIKGSYIHHRYDYAIEALHRKKSIPDHFHLHLIVAK